MSLFDVTTVSAWIFADDEDINIPFFQRKSTWRKNQRLGFALSVFRGYPIGTVVVKQTRDEVLLLDGRQRRETLQQLQSPASVHDWARAELRVIDDDRMRRLRAKEWSDRAVVVRAFRLYADEFFFGEQRDPAAPSLVQDERSEEQQTDLEAEATHPPDISQGADNVEGGTSSPSENGTRDSEADDLHPDLRDLFDVIWLGRSVPGAAGARPYLASLFDVSSQMDGVSYIEQGGPRSGQVNFNKLLTQIQFEKKTFRKANPSSAFPPTGDELRSWLVESVAGGSVRDEAALDLLLDLSAIGEALSTLDRMEKALKRTFLGYVVIQPEAEEADDMKVFSLINTGGTQLTGPEVLCATPSWNRAITNAPAEVAEDARALHEAKGVKPPEDVIHRWDKAATFLDRIKAPVAFGPADSWSWHKLTATQFDTKINLGFRLLAGLAEGKLMKNDVARLAQSNRAVWDTLAHEDAINDSYDTAVDQPFFRLLREWGFVLRTRVGEYPTHAFLLVNQRDYSAKSGQGGLAGAARHVYHKNAVIRFDRLVYEYVTGAWGHAADSRVAQELRSIDNRLEADKAFVEMPVADGDWNLLAKEVVGGQIGGRAYSDAGGPDPRIVVLLYYANVIARIPPHPPGDEPVEVDHIIPRALFRENNDSSLALLENHVANLALLNRTVNNYKSDRRLNEIDDAQRQAEVARLTQIPAQRFPDFSSVGTADGLRILRAPKLQTILTTERAKMVTDPRVFFDPRRT